MLSRSLLQSLSRSLWYSIPIYVEAVNPANATVPKENVPPEPTVGITESAVRPPAKVLANPKMYLLIRASRIHSNVEYNFAAH